MNTSSTSAIGSGFYTDTTKKDTAFIENRLNMSYIEVPILCKLVGSFKRGTTIDLYLGAVPAYRVSVDGGVRASVDDKIQYQSMSKQDAKLIRNQTSNYDVGAAIGTSLTLNYMEKVNLLFDVRYTLGLLKIYYNDQDSPITGAIGDSKHRNSVVSILVGCFVNF